jgi:crotonobetainyl-CoA:carnitine CoA-transferase CaiB-like acyl-CoA transferase
VLVLEVGGYLSGPYATMLLGDLGANVIKIERPGAGDPFRKWDGERLSPTFASVNRNKRSVALDLGGEEGRSVFGRLVARADVLVCNLRPSTVASLGLTYGELAAKNQRLVYCAISGFGEEGQAAELPGYDTVGQALGGLLSLLTDLRAPEIPGISVSDHVTGVFACTGVLAALYARERTGRGQKVETSLLQATVSFVQEAAARALAGGEAPARATRPASAQAYAFVAGDGLPFVLHLSSPGRFWEGLTEALGRPELRDDPRFATRAARVTHYEAMRGLLAEVFARDTRESWLERLSRHGVPCAPIRTVAEALASDEVQALGFPVELDHPRAGRIRLAGSPVRLAATPVSYRFPPPLLGEHTDEVLEELARGEP